MEVLRQKYLYCLDKAFSELSDQDLEEALAADIVLFNKLELVYTELAQLMCYKPDGLLKN